MIEDTFVLFCSAWISCWQIPWDFIVTSDIAVFWNDIMGHFGDGRGDKTIRQVAPKVFGMLICIPTSRWYHLLT